MKVPRARWLWPLVLAAILVCGALYFWWRPPPVRTPALPAIDLSGHDPQIVAVIERARAEVVAAPASSRAWGTLGAALMVHKFHREAIACFVEAERLDPREPRWPYLHGVSLLTYDQNAALPKLQRGAELAGDAVIAPRLRVAHLLLELGRADEAEPYLASVLRQHPDDPQALLGKGKLEVARGRLAEALKFLGRSAADPQTARASHALMATLRQRLGDSAGTEEASRKAASLPRDPPLADPYVNETGRLLAGLDANLIRADRLLKSGNIQEALGLNEQIVASYPRSARAWQMLGQTLIEAKRYEDAEKALRRAAELAPESGEIHFQLGSALFAQGAVAEASDCFRRTIALRPGYAAAHYNLGHCLLKEGARTAAIEAFREAIRYEPAFGNAHRQLGAALALEGRFTEALEPLRRAVELNPKDAMAVQMLERATLRSREQP